MGQSADAFLDARPSADDFLDAKAAAPESYFHQALRGLLSVPDIAVTGAENIPHAILSSAYDLGQRVTGHAGEPQPAWINALQAHLAPATQYTLREAANLPSIRQAGQAVSAADQKLGEISPTAQDIAHQGLQVGGDVLNLTGGLQAANAVGGIVKNAGKAIQETASAPTAGAPTKEELATQARNAYRRADQSGVIVTPDSFGDFKKSLTADLQGDTLDPTLHPRATAALKRVIDSEGPQSLQQIENLRRIALDAESTPDAADARLAGKIVDSIDSYMQALGPKDIAAGNSQEGVQALQQARDLWTRKSKADTLDELMRRASLRAPNFSASGMENAVRTEFRALAMNKARLARFTPDEQAAITRVAKGAPVENALRLLGKLSPTGGVSAAAAAYLGSLAGGPVGAAAAAGSGLAARGAATYLTLRNARLANELVRRGPQAAPVASAADVAARPSLPSIGVLHPDTMPQTTADTGLPAGVLGSNVVNITRPGAKMASAVSPTTRKPPGIAELLKKAARQQTTAADEQKLIDAGYAVRSRHGDFILRPAGPNSSGTLEDILNGTD